MTQHDIVSPNKEFVAAAIPKIANPLVISHLVSHASSLQALCDPAHPAVKGKHLTLWADGFFPPYIKSLHLF